MAQRIQEANGDKTYSPLQNPQNISPFSVTERHNLHSWDPELLQYENIDKAAVKGNICLVKTMFCAQRYL